MNSEQDAIDELEEANRLLSDQLTAARAALANIQQAIAETKKSFRPNKSRSWVIQILEEKIAKGALAQAEPATGAEGGES